MSRATGRLPPLFTLIPWWLYVLAAVASYAFLKHVGPGLAADAGYGGIANLFALLAPIITIALLLLAAARLYEGEASEQSPPQPPADDEEDDSDDADQDPSPRP